MLIRITVQFGRRTVDKDNVPVIGKFQDAADVVGMQFAYFIHHTVQFEIFEFA